jgi:hypothetical protein
MTRPLPVLAALAVSIVLGTLGFSAMIGVLDAIASADGLALGVPVAAIAIIAALVFAGESVKASLLNWVRERHDDGGRWNAPALMGAGGFAFFTILSVCLSHEGLRAGERAFIAPVTALLDAEIARADAVLRSREADLSGIERREAARVGRVQAEIEAQPRDWRGDRERERLRATSTEIELVGVERIAVSAALVTAARENIATARAARAAAPQGFSALTVAPPFLGVVAFVPWLVAIGIEFLTGFVGWIAAARPPRVREVYLTDILEMDAAGLDLITDEATVRAIGSRASSIATKAARHWKGAKLRGAV